MDVLRLVGLLLDEVEIRKAHQVAPDADILKYYALLDEDVQCELHVMRKNIQVYRQS